MGTSRPKLSEHEMAEEQLRQLYESPNQEYGIFTLDAQGFITTWNNGAARMKRYTSEEAIGRHFSMLYPEDARQRDEPMDHLRDAVKYGRYQGEGVRVRKGNIPFIADVQITPMYRDGKLIGFSKVVADVTEQGQIKQEREDAIRDLRIEQDLREKFVTTLTHDLRNPLASAKAALELIAKRPCDESNVRLTRLAMQNLARIDSMITDLLDVNRIRAGERMPLNLRATDITKLTSEIIALLSAVCGDRFRLDSSEVVVGYWDGNALKRVIENLAANATKHGDPFKPITIRVCAKGDRVHVAIHNFGEPISAEDQKSIFDQFQRSKSDKSRKTKGWGIGLSLVRGIVEAHGGTVTVKSDEASGTTFIVDLPKDSRGVLKVAS